MNKSYFFNIVTITIIVATMPTMCMEESLTIPEKPKFTVTLHLYEPSYENIQESWGRSFDEGDKHNLKVLGIEWKGTNNLYWAQKALLRKSDNTKDFGCWKCCLHPKGLPYSTIANNSIKEPSQYSVYFPKFLPATFVERLKKEESITLTNTSFTDPVEIVVQLGSISNFLPDKTGEQTVESIDNAIITKNKNLD